MDKEQTKAKTAEEIIRSKKISLHNDDENGICYVEMRFIDCVSSIIEYSAPLQSHIANLEAQNKELVELLSRAYEVIDVVGNTRLVEDIGKAIK